MPPPDPFYDILEDYDLIAASFSAQYGIRMYDAEFKDMRWLEFKALLEGLGPDTPLGRIVAIRSEENRDVLAAFTPQQREIRSEWRKRKAREAAPESLEKMLGMMQGIFEGLSGGR